MDSVDPYRILQVRATAEQEVIHAAFRALAMKYHPDRDGSPEAKQRMLALNAAYALVRDDASRRAWDRSQQQGGATRSTPGTKVPPPPRSDAAGTRISFGRYEGWTLRDLARHDPEYLRWLGRHSSGIAYRTEIYQLLGRRPAAA